MFLIDGAFEFCNFFIFLSLKQHFMSDSEQTIPLSTVHNVRGYYAIPKLSKDRKYSKFCGHCGYQVRGEKYILKKHCMT